LIERIEKHLNQAMGLDAQSIGHPAVERAVRIRMAACGLDEQAYWQQLLASASETQELIEAVVIPETWFFRDRRSFQALTTEVLAKTNPEHACQPARLLSFPCATGEEPYSLAMALLDGGFLPRNFKIDAWDISLRALACAERGTYGKNSFRGADLRYRNRHFDAIGSEYEVNSRVRSQIRFQQANVLSGETLAPGYLYDVIFCRNMLIYFDRESQRRAVQALAGLLTPRGTLFVGPSEGAPLIGNGFVSAGIPGSFAFRKSGAISPARPASIPVSADRRSSRRRTNSTGTAEMTRRSVAVIAEVVHGGAENSPSSARKVDRKWVELVLQLADAGRLSEATELCDFQLASAEPFAQAFYVKALLHDALGESQNAIALYRKALYLDPQHHESLIQLGAALLRGGDRSGAQNLFDRAARLTGSGHD
jgi:chemotaxis protein methyltransferase WspC